jgi:hypothetical protein
VSRVHPGQELICHAKNRPNRKHPYGDAKHRQQGANFIMPQVKPDLIPNYAHRKKSRNKK